MNPRAAVNDLLPFQGSPFGQLGYFSTVARIAFILYYHMIFSCNERRGWDSNPRALADKRFSRPPRYDHFDTSPVQSAKLIISSNFRFVNTFFDIFLFLKSQAINAKLYLRNIISSFCTTLFAFCW